MTTRGKCYTHYMALFIRQDESRSKLQEQIAAELQDKARARAEKDNIERPDGVTDSHYLKDTKQTTSLAWIWILIIVLAIGALIWLTIVNTTATMSVSRI
ncbi:MAG: hypothetical protein JWN33_329 [Candidatus Saccharibacteria bacterium]|nr:hypothetical protein [Candidatus Saccharibacteria bacterium]